MLSLHNKLAPISQLGDVEYQRLFAKSQTENLRRGSILKKNDFRNWFIYLLEGDVSVIDQSGKQHFLLADNERFRRPLFGDKFSFEKVVASSDIVIIKFDIHLFDMLSKGELSMETVEDVSVNSVESEIFETIFAAYASNNIELPLLPDVAVRVRKAVEKDDVSIEHVAHIIEADPALVGQLLRLANSVAFRTLHPIETIKDAVLRLGLTATRDYVMVFTLKNLFKTNSMPIKALMKKFYRHSIQVATVSFAIARLQEKLKPEHALLAGLLHDIGVIPILNYANQLGASADIEYEIEAVAEKLKPIVGGMLLRQWELDQSFIDCAEHSEQWSRDVSPDVDYCDLVILAQLHHTIRPQLVGDPPDMEDIPAYRKLAACTTDPNCSEKIFEIAHDEIAELMTLLGM